ncbi:lectin [Dyella lipolytica]|uniref:lectin n=1 Tax=Dyella lipolytica TaxID=1867835 RepID=UPI00384A6B6A
MLTILVASATLLAGCQGAPPASSPTTSASTAAAAATSPVTSSAAVAPESMARYDGFGDMRFGMDERTFRHAWQGDLAGTATTDGSCYYLTPKWIKSASDFGFMFEQGRFVRYDVGNAKEVAPGGGKVGMTVAEIRALYGNRIEETPHKYLPGALYLRIAGDHQGVLLFETDAAGKISRWRIGVPPQIDYVEGCS